MATEAGNTRSHAALPRSSENSQGKKTGGEAQMEEILRKIIAQWRHFASVPVSDGYTAHTRKAKEEYKRAVKQCADDLEDAIRKSEAQITDNEKTI